MKSFLHWRGISFATTLAKQRQLSNNFKTLLSFSLSVLLFVSSALSQTTTTFPDPNSCTSKDLYIVGATLTGGDQCNTCTPGTQITRTLTLSINNTTGSNRTAFAFWGILKTYNGSTGALRDSVPIQGCNDQPLPGNTSALPPNTITTLAFQNITYTCGDMLKITDLWLAWTDASDKSNCASINSALIAPKCGTLPSITINAGVNAEFTLTNLTCFGANTGAINMTPSGGTGPYTYSWTASNGGVIPSGQTTSEDLTGLVAGTYTVLITDANNCTVTKSRSVTGPAAALSLGTCSKTDVSCAGGDGSVTAGTVTNAVGTAHYSWKNSSNTEIGTSTTVNSLSAGTYTLTVTDDCSSKTCSVTVSAPPAITTPAATVTQPTCTVATGTVTVTNPDGNTIYTLTQNGSTVYTANSGGLFLFVAPGTYGLKASNGTCSATGDNITVNSQPSSPAAPSTSGDQQCEQNPLQTLTATATPPAGGSIVWYDAATNGNIVSTPTLNSVGTVTYYAEAVAANGCHSLTRTAVTLTINAAPDAPTSGGDQTACEQSPIQTLTATATPPVGSTVLWFDNAIGGSSVTPTLNKVGSVTYYAESVDANQCHSLTRTPVTLTINAAPNAPISGGNQTECEQSPIQTLTATTGAGFAPVGVVQWYDAATGGNLVTDPTLNHVGSVTYYAEAVDANGCHSLTRTAVTLTINAAPDAPASGGDQTACEQSPIQTLTASATVPAGFSVVWYDAANGGNVVANPTRSTTGSATYYAAAKNNTTNCYSLTRTAVTLTINPAPNAPASGGNQTECEQSPIQTLTASATVPAGFSVVWYDAANGGNVVANPTRSTTGSVTYYAAAKNNTTNCYSLTRTTVALTINPAPAAPTSGGNKTECATSPIQTLIATATAPSGGSIVWYNSATGGSIVASPTLNTVGTARYYAEAVGSNGCHSLTRTGVTLTINATPNLVINAPASPCTPGTVDLTATSVTDGSSLYGAGLTYYRDNNGKPGTAMAEAEAKSAGPGTYWIIATISTTHCADTGSVTIAVNNCGGLIYETNVACRDFLSSAATLDKICYTVAATTKGRNTVNTITNATPGVFFYYAKVVSPGTAAFTVDVHQFNTSSNPILPNFAVQKGQVYAFDANCTKIATGRLVGEGDASITISGVPAGEMVVISVKYDIKTIVGKSLSNVTGPDYQAYFISKIGSTVLNSTAGNIHVYNCNATPPPVTTARVTSEATVTVYPNPYTDQVRFNIVSPVSGRAILEVHDLLGRRIAIIYQGNLQAGVQRTVEYRIPAIYRTAMIYTLRVGDHTTNGKLFPVGGIHY